MNKFMLVMTGLLAVFLLNGVASAEKDKIIHDAEYAIIEAQNGEQWAQDDKVIDAKLAELRKKMEESRRTLSIFYLMMWGLVKLEWTSSV